MGKLDDAGRTIAGLIGYNPGPGIYSRLERAIEDMPANVRVQELPGLLKRYKEGVPGWEIKEVLTPDLTEGVQSIPRQDLLDAVKERSPVYTHKEIVLGGRPQMGTPLFDVPEYQESASSLGKGTSHGEPVYQDYGQGGSDYTELLLLQPNNTGYGYGNHWAGRGDKSQDAAVAHARFDTHGDALRINELQSDLGIHNRKAREARQQLESQVAIPETYAMAGAELPFPLGDAWADILIKRLALEAARQGHRAIEVASPRAIADKVGGNIDNYEHFYGKVVPGAIERLGRKMGGLALQPKDPGLPFSRALSYRAAQLPVQRELQAYAGMARMWSTRANQAYEALVEAMRHSADPEVIRPYADHLHGALMHAEELGDLEAANNMQQLMAIAHSHALSRNADSLLSRRLQYWLSQEGASEAGKRYIMSDEMRKRILTQGIGAAVAAPVLSDDDLIERLNQ